MGVGAARESAKMRDRRDAPDAPSAHTRNRKDRRDGFVEPRTGPVRSIAHVLSDPSRDRAHAARLGQPGRAADDDHPRAEAAGSLRHRHHLPDRPRPGHVRAAARGRPVREAPGRPPVRAGHGIHRPGRPLPPAAEPSSRRPGRRRLPGARHRERPRVAGHRAADGARRADRHAQRVPPGRGRGLLRRGVRSDLPVCRPRRPRPRQHAAPRPAGQGSPDRRPDRPREPPGLPRAAAGGGRAGAPVPAASIAGRVRSRRLQAAERRPRPSAGRRRAVGGCGCRLRGAPSQRRGLSGGRRGVRDPAAGDQQARCQGRRRPFVQPGACTRHRAPDDRVLRRCGFPRRRCEPDGAAGGG